MSILDKNKIFFGLIHYVFSEQDNVDWAFKTSLVNFTGINAENSNGGKIKINNTNKNHQQKVLLNILIVLNHIIFNLNNS